MVDSYLFDAFAICRSRMYNDLLAVEVLAKFYMHGI